MTRAVRASYVLLDRIEPGVTPAYCTHGQATCVACDEWVWLGSNTVSVVTDGDALPLCMECGRRYLPADAQPVRNLADHRRADGPHA